MDLNVIKGLGTKRIELLKSKGIESVTDLALYFPRSYYDLSNNESFLEDGKFRLIKAKVVTCAKVARIRKDFGYCYFEAVDEIGNKFKPIFYNQPYIKNVFKVDETVYFFGKNSSTKHGYFIVSTYVKEQKIKEGTTLLPVYKTFKGIGQTTLKSFVDQALKLVGVNSFLPENIEKQYLELSLESAVKKVHDPKSKQELTIAKTRIDIEKILPYIKYNEDIKKQKTLENTRFYTNFDHILRLFCDFLPYTLTLEQTKVINQIMADMKNHKPINRLIQGDVGSGKTIVSLIVLAIAVSSGYSAMLVAPTEILAKQHYQEALKYFSNLGLNVSLLTGKTTLADRKEISNCLSSNKPILIVGTQACLNDEFVSDNLAMLVIDEQHRFGVKQRAKLLNKSKNIDLIMLSATPIPRSMSLIYYGGLDLSVLSKTPFVKQIQTNIVKESKEDDMWQFIKTNIENNAKAYVVCSNIDENDDDSYIGLSAKEMYNKLSHFYGKENVQLAHGKLTAEQAEKVLDNFKNGSAKILVSTTVIEVGIDIKDANIMVIVSPEKFGLATLHQLRGRIGRAGQKSYCFCMARNLSENSFERIDFFKNHTDGFEIAEFDYTSRGAGNILGTNQHGKTDNIFEFISLSTFNKATSLYNQLKNLDIDFSNNKTYLALSEIAMN